MKAKPMPKWKKDLMKQADAIGKMIKDTDGLIVVEFAKLFNKDDKESD